MSETAPDPELRRRYTRRSIVGVVLLVLLAFPAAIGSQRSVATMFNSPFRWVPEDLPERVQWEEFTRDFGVGDMLLASWPGATLDSHSLQRGAEALQPLTESTADRPAPLAAVISGHDVLERMTSRPINLPEPIAVGRLSGSLVGPDGQQSCLVIAISDDGDQLRATLLPEILERLSDATGLPVAEIRLVGPVVDGWVIDEASIRSVRRFAPPSAIVAAILCLLCLRSWMLTAAIVSVAVIGEGLVLAAVGWTGTPMNAVLIVLPPLVFVLTVSAGIHLSNYYLDAANEFPGQPREHSVRMAVRAGVPPAVLAACTTVIGLATLTLVPLVPVRIFGLVAAWGVLTTLVLLVLVLPGAMLWTPAPSAAAAPRWRHVFQRFWLRELLRIPLSRAPHVIAVFAVLLVLTGVGLTRLQTSVNVPRMLSADHPLREAYAWFEEHVGSTVTLDVVLRFAQPDQSDPFERLQLVRQIHSELTQAEGVSGVLSAASFLPPPPPRAGGFAATARRAALRSQIERDDSSLAELGYIARGDDGIEQWRIGLRLPLREGIDYEEELQRIETLVHPLASGSSLGVSSRFTGSMVITEAAQRVLLRGLFRSFLTAFAIVAVMMMFLLRGPISGLLSMIPNLFPTVTLFGAMGLASWPLDIGSVMTASVALGIAVDDTVHLLSRFGSRRARGLGRPRAVAGALRQCGPAMLQTTIVCGVSLLVYAFSEFLPTQRFALMMLGLLTAALLGDVLLLPAMLASPLGPWLARPVGASPEAPLEADEAPALLKRPRRRRPLSPAGATTERETPHGEAKPPPQHARPDATEEGPPAPKDKPAAKKPAEK